MVLLGLQVLLMAIGLGLMLSKRIPLGKEYEIPSPWTFFMGAILFFHVPICFLAGGAAAELELQRAISIGDSQLNAKKFAERWGWLDAAITAGAATTVAVLGLASIRRRPLTEKRYEAPVGVRDYVFESKLQEFENPRPRN